jgi:hypothetical protein
MKFSHTVHIMDMGTKEKKHFYIETNLQVTTWNNRNR